MTKYTNTHLHIFTANYAPDYYLKVAMPNSLGFLAPIVKTALESGGGQFLISRLLHVANFLTPHKRAVLERYLEFVKIGTTENQLKLFEDLRKCYGAMFPVRYVPLTLNMDHMDIDKTSSHANINAQLLDVERLVAIYPNELLPLVSVDPRHNVPDLLAWLQQYLRPDGAFYGIKIYPSKGFFPFDPRLDKVYAWAEENEIPIMTHCTRSGSFYVGKFEHQVFPNPPSLNPQSPSMQKIYERIQATINDKKVHSDNSKWCNIYTHPEHYLPVLEKYPNLKLCFAHLGGSTEVMNTPATAEPLYLGPNWYELIKGLLADTRFPNLYADISYTLSKIEALEKIKQDLRNHDRVLFGTDYYMTEQEETHETDLIDNFFKVYDKAGVEKFAVINPENYLRSKLKPNLPS